MNYTIIAILVVIAIIAFYKFRVLDSKPSAESAPPAETAPGSEQPPAEGLKGDKSAPVCEGGVCKLPKKVKTE